MIIAGIRPPDPAEVARQLRELMARAGEVGEPRSGDHPWDRTRTHGTQSAEDPPPQEDDAAN